MPFYRGSPRVPPPVEQMFVLYLMPHNHLALGIHPSDFEAPMKERYERDGTRVYLSGTWEDILVLADVDMCLAEVLELVWGEIGVKVALELFHYVRGWPELLYFETTLAEIGRVSTQSPRIYCSFIGEDEEDGFAKMNAMYHAPSDSK
eukprot:TRINITY_DN1644_c0_g1_i1.p2 TRINITY_DN1644_c0_g1~~TRINITY_DN1644_c0_g1_i1.p2  ORF type:complete len:148 (-),score=27.38 TRINITY_DN1644_c0_g1_i1:115-558(-)